MDKRNFVFNYVMKKSDFDDLQNDAERGLNDLGKTIVGKSIVAGLSVTFSGTNATIGSGIAFDGAGKPIRIDDSMDVDISAIARPEIDKIKWVTVVVKHAYRNQGSITDGNNMIWPARLIDHYTTELIEGTQGTAQAATKPAVTDEQVPLVDIKVDQSTAWASLETESNRRPNPMPNILDIVYPVGYLYAQYPGGLTPSGMLWPGTWEAQFETEGVFFRTPGGQASSFGSGIQEDAMQRITGYLGRTNNYAGRIGTPTGVFSGVSSGSATGIGRGRSDGYTGISFDSSSSISPNAAKTNDVETRSRNRTFRIWKRTA